MIAISFKTPSISFMSTPSSIKSYAFTFLVQSFLPAQRAGPPRSLSPAAGASTATDEEGVDMKEIDGVLNRKETLHQEGESIGFNIHQFAIHLSLITPSIKNNTTLYIGLDL
jgi:hypothetical protein